MLKATCTSSLRRLLITAIASATACWSLPAQAQDPAVAGISDPIGIELAPGETILETLDGESGMPVPMFNAQTNQPITAGAAASHGHDGSCQTCSGCFGGCEPGCYVRGEALFMRRQGDDQQTLTPKFALGEFDHEFGGRVTLGRMMDCVEGYEAVFTGMLEWDLSAQRATDPAIVPNTFITPGAGLGAGFLDVFTNADFQRQTYQAEYNSFELNRIHRGWDVIQTMAGFRYIDYSEEFQYSVLDSLGPPNGATAGFLRSDIENRMIGGQVGIDMAYPLSERLWTVVKARGGVFMNFTDSVFQVVTNANTQTIIANNSEEETDLSGLVEFGTSFRYNLGPSLALTAGYEFWYLANVATVPSQLTTSITPASGSTIDISDDVFFHGAVFGAEFSF